MDRHRTAKNSYVNMNYLLVMSLMLAWLTHYPQTVRADETEKATLEVKMKNDARYCSYEFYVDDKLMLTVKPGQNKKCQFTPNANGKTKFKDVLYSLFGTKTSEDENEWQVGPGGLVEYDFSPGADYFQGVRKSGWDVSNLKVVLDKDSYEREISSEIVHTLPGVKRTIKRSRTIERSVSVANSDSVEKSVAATIGVFSTNIRGKIEESRHSSFKESETIEQVAEIDGKELPKVKVVWVERTLRGKATVLIDGKETEVPISFPEQLEMRLEAIK